MVFFIEASLRPVYIDREAYYILNITDLSLQVEAETALGVKQNELELVIYKVAHELQGPLSSIFGLIQLMQSPTLDRTQILYYLDMVEKSAQKLESTLREIIMFNDIYAHQIRQERFTALDIFQKTIENVIHTSTVSPPSSLIVIQDYKTYFVHIFWYYSDSKLTLSRGFPSMLYP